MCVPVCVLSCISIDQYELSPCPSLLWTVQGPELHQILPFNQNFKKQGLRIMEMNVVWIWINSNWWDFLFYLITCLALSQHYCRNQWTKPVQWIHIYIINPSKYSIIYTFYISAWIYVYRAFLVLMITKELYTTNPIHIHIHTVCVCVYLKICYNTKRGQ